MDIKHSAAFFLGANSKNGFYSLYDRFADIPGGDYVWMIKGGPGCGKSTFMRRIGAAAEAAGMTVEYICCSGDPESLDGIYIAEKRLAYVDATAPHVMDGVLPAAGDMYLNLGRFYRAGELQDEREHLAAINARYKSLYRYVYSLLKAAGELDTGSIPGLITEADRAAVRRRARSAAEREMGRPRRGAAAEDHRFISAVSCLGLIRLSGTVEALCRRLYLLGDEYGLADEYLHVLAAEAHERSVGAIVCRDPLSPEKYEAVLLPELELGFCAAHGSFCELALPARNVRLDAVIPRDRVHALRRTIRQTEKLRGALLDQALDGLREAKALHDEIEAIYNPHVDFDGIYDLSDEHIRALLCR